MSWDPKVVDRALQMQGIMLDIQKTQFKEPPSNGPVATQTPVPQTKDSAATRSSYDRAYEVLDDPPATVLKYVNRKTKEVEYQVPSEVSLKIYKQMLGFIEKIR
jgi:hypothetical protein